MPKIIANSCMFDDPGKQLLISLLIGLGDIVSDVPIFNLETNKLAKPL